MLARGIARSSHLWYCSKKIIKRVMNSSYYFLKCNKWFYASKDFFDGRKQYSVIKEYILNFCKTLKADWINALSYKCIADQLDFLSGSGASW